MTTQPVEANVVLTADNSQYDQAMQQSAGSTDNLGKSVDGLGAKIDRLTKSAGRKLLGISAADVGVITAATAAYASWEKQMAGLNVQAQALNRTVDGGHKTFQTYSNDVNDLRRNFGLTTTEAAQLEQTVSRMSDHTTGIQDLTRVFSTMSKATQESSVGLASSMLQLGRAMGTPQRDTERYANQLTVLSARANTSATSIADFAASIAPVARSANISQTDLMGMSTAFAKAGADGSQAANVFTKMLSDITQATQTGSPMLNQYANLVGVTTGRFKEMGGTEQLTRIFDAINKQGPQAITTLNQMGLDGVRTVRTMQSLAQQGGLVQEINAARGAQPGTMNRSASAGMDEIGESLKRLRAELAETAEAFGSRFAGPAKAFLGVLTEIAGVIRGVVSGPLGGMAALIMGVAAPFAALAGTVLMASKALAAFAAINQVVRGGVVTGFRETAAMGPAQMNAAEELGLIAGGVGPGRMSAGAQAEAVRRRGSWSSRLFYNVGADAARFTGAGARARMIAAGEAVPPSLVSRMTGYGFAGAAGLTNLIGQMAYGPGAVRIPGVAGSGGYNDITRRPNLFTAPTFRESVRGGFGSTANWFRNLPMMFQAGLFQGSMERGGGGFRMPGGQTMSATDMEEAYRINKRYDELGKSKLGNLSTSAERLEKAMSDVAATQGNTARAAQVLGREAMTASSGMSRFGRSMANLLGMMGATGVGLARTGAGALGRLGEMTGLGTVGTGAALGLGALYYSSKWAEHRPGEFTDTTQLLSPYYSAAGAQGPAPITAMLAPTPTTTRSQALNITTAEAQAAGAEYQLVNTGLQGLSREEAEARLGAQWSSMSKNPQMIQSMANDLTHLYGADQARLTLKNLQNNQAQNMNIFAQEAAKPSYGFLGYKHLLGGTPLGVSTGPEQDQLSQFYGGLREAQAQNQDMFGAKKAGQMYGEALEGGVNQFLSQKQYSDEITKTFQESFAQQVLGIKPEDIEWASQGGLFGIGRHGGATTGGATDLRSLYEQLFSSEGYLGQNEELRRQALTTLGVSDVGLTGSAAAKAAYEATKNPPATEEEQSNLDKIAKFTDALTRGAGGILELPKVARAIDQTGNVNAQFNAQQIIARRALRGAGGDFGAAINYLMTPLAMGGGDVRAGAPQISGAIAEIQKRLSYQMPYMSRTEGFAAQTGLYQGIMTGKLGQGFGIEQRQQAEATYQQQVQQQYDYFKGLLYQQREYEVMRTRAQEDYNLQRQYQEEDFNRQRTRAEEAYDLQRSRAIRDHNIQNRRAWQDFYISRRRAEADFNHQTEVMAKQAAASIFDVYQRVQAQRTQSSEQLLYNATDQLQRMRQQQRDLRDLRREGLSEAAIRQFGLADPKNQQEVQRLVTELTPRLIRQYNQVSRGRERVAQDFVTDPSSLDWTERLRSFNQGMDRTMQDMRRSMRRNNADFTRGLHDMQVDFQTVMDQQADDYKTMMNRQERAYNTTMERAAEDLERSAKTIDGNFEHILKLATERLSGHAKDQAKAVLQEFDDLKTSTDPKAIAIMESLASIFGFKYKPPAGAVTGNTNATVAEHNMNQAGGDPMSSSPVSRHEGGMVPGYTPGRDTMQINVGGGEAIMRPEWARAMGAGAIDAMNHQAKYGGFANGGVVDPDGRVYMDGEPVSRITKAQLLLAERLSKSNLTTIQGSWQPYTSYSGSSHMGPGVVDEGPGSFTTQYWLRRVGFAAWARNIPGAAYVGSGAHVHAVSRLDPGASNQPQLSSFARGEDGLGGRDYGPNPGLLPGLMGMLRQFTDLQLASGAPGITGAAVSTRAAKFAEARALLRDSYPGPEKAAHDMTGVHPLDPGDISKVINRFARKTIAELHDKWYGRGAIFSSPQMIGVGESGPEAVIPLNDQGGEFLARSIGLGSSPKRGGWSVYNTRIDRSTNFTGAITVQANDPMELMKKLQARQQVMALRRPSLTGSAA